MIFTKKEIKHLIFAILLIALAFGFDDKQSTFMLSYWLYNYIKIALIVTATILVYLLAQKLIAYYYGTNTEYHLWNIKRYWFHPSCILPIRGTYVPAHGKWIEKSIYNIKSIFVGPILLLIISFFSLGKLFFIAIGGTEIIEKWHLRAQRRWMHLEGFEKAQITVAGPFAALILALLLKAINPNLTHAIFISQMFSIFNMIPLGKLDGAKIFLGSLPFYFFSLSLIILTLLLMTFLSSIQALLIAFVFALAILIYILIRLFGK